MEAAEELREASAGTAPYYQIPLPCANCNAVYQGKIPVPHGARAVYPDQSWECPGCGHLNHKLLPSGPVEIIANPTISYESGFEMERVAAHLELAAAAMDAATVATDICTAIAVRLRELAKIAHGREGQKLDIESLEWTLTALEEKLFATLTAAASEDLLVGLKEHAARELAPYRSRMGAVQLRQVERQFVQKQLLVHYSLPRLSLFYMSQQ